jgi:hypothetical protein
MDATQIVSQNLAPMLDAIRSYGQQIAKERELADQRQYQAELRKDERTYQEGRTADERTYQERVRDKTRADAFADEARKRKIENERTITRAFPGEDTSKMSDAQLESRALEATRKLTRDDVLSKSESDLRAEAQKMGIANFDKAPVAELRKSVEDKKVQEQIDAKQKAVTAEEDFQTGRLATDAGKGALTQYNQLRQEKADLLRKMVSMSGAPDDVPVDKAAVGARMIQLMGEGDISMAPDEIEIGKKLYDLMTDPRNTALKTSILDVIRAGDRPSMEALSKIPGLTPRDQAFLIGLNARAISDVTRQDPKMITALAAADRNSIYSQKYFIAEQLKSIDTEMNRMTSEFPALRKIPTIDMEHLTSPKPPAQPSGGVPGGPPVSAFPATGATAGQASLGSVGGVSANGMPPMPPAPMSVEQVRANRGAVPEQFGPPGPRDAFIQEGIRLGQLAARGGANTAGMQADLTTPFYENVASTLGIKPQQVGASVFEKRPRSIVADNFPNDQFNALPEDVKNKLYLDALAAAANTPKQPYSIFGRKSNELPFLDWAVNRE